MIDIIRYNAISRSITLIDGPHTMRIKEVRKSRLESLFTALNAAVDHGKFNVFATIDGFVAYRQE